MRQSPVRFVAIAVFLIWLPASGTLAAWPPPHGVVVPDARADNQGKYLCPFTRDGVLAEWTDMAIKAKAGASIGTAAGQIAGTEATKRIPFIGGFLGAKAGAAAGRKIALERAGGEQFVRETSDISFDDVDAMAVYMYATFSGHEHYQDALDAAQAIYPDLAKAYPSAIKKAGKAYTKSRK